MKKIITAVLTALVFASNFAAAFAATDADAAKVASGTGRSDVRIALGEPAKQSANGVKEVYTLSNGGEAVIIYNEWGYVSHGYIVR